MATSQRLRPYQHRPLLVQRLLKRHGTSARVVGVMVHAPMVGVASVGADARASGVGGDATVSAVTDG